MGTSVREKSKLSRGLRQAAGARRLRARTGPAIQTVEPERRPIERNSAFGCCITVPRSADGLLGPVRVHISRSVVFVRPADRAEDGYQLQPSTPQGNAISWSGLRVGYAGMSNNLPLPTDAFGDYQIISFHHASTQRHVVSAGIVCKLAGALGTQGMNDVVVRSPGNGTLELSQNRVIPMDRAIPAHEHSIGGIKLRDRFGMSGVEFLHPRVAHLGHLLVEVFRRRTCLRSGLGQQRRGENQNK